ncbi:hypothetical protein E5676_scaffold8046G00010 [Cucumis melo var. makuwa]|uniref:Uncharacterized protein n=1 Tax=Cucumis melo var. makuwa TaxID=1194695 RepID=A0A5A7TND1_CUCMM|nr:hypothetical protein E6C27_scaffold30G00080 [Cucumis melo var. makuwa]TYK14177.1 hypothetical protein E5676_scaffold8046G00010 [Cucumis melo var. makuwa]
MGWDAVTKCIYSLNGTVKAPTTVISSTATVISRRSENVSGRDMRAILFRRWMQKLQICLEGVGEHNDNGGDKQNGGGKHKGADEHISGDKHNGGSDGYSKKKWADPI